MTDDLQHGGLAPISEAIAAAEEVADPLDGLVQRAEHDPSAPFAPDVLSRLCEVMEDDRAAYEGLRAQLKKAGCRVTTLDDLITKERGNGKARGPSQADMLIGLAANAGLFHAADGAGYADIQINGHRETWSIRSKGFKRWLYRQFYEATGGAPNSEALQSALNVIEARAHFDAPQMDVHIRVAGYASKLYLDFVDDEWRAVEIDEAGWRVVEDPPVRFRRAAGMQPLLEPEAGGSVDMLRPFLNVSNEDDFVLVVAWALAVLRNRGPYPVIVLSGEQGSAKSTFSAILRALLDPNTAPLRALPREDRDLFITATNGHVLTFDNVSGLPAWISDTLCRLATGGGFAVRQLYTDQDEVLFDAARPVILNGIEDTVSRPDLADRAIVLTLEPIPESRRQSEAALWSDFDDACPQILGALLDAVSNGLRCLPETRLNTLPRMGDFALWATACEGALWPEGTFMDAYAGNRDEAVDSVIEADPVACAVRSMMEGQTVRTVRTGTASELLESLDEKVAETIRRSRSWPTTPRALSGRLRRAAPFLRKIGIDIEFTKEGRARTRIITISKDPENLAPGPSAPSASAGDDRNRAHTNDCSADDMQTVGPSADANEYLADGGRSETVRAERPITEAADGADDEDANTASQPSEWRTRI